MGVGGPGGPGIVGIANGGGIGFSASASAPSQISLQIAEQRANQELNAQFAQIDQTLQELIASLKANSITPEKKETTLERLKKTWMPKVLVSVISVILEKTLEAAL
jgi:hypothetical protein